MRTLEHIKRGLYNKAQARLQVQESDLDQEKKLFLNWMAYELYGLHKELDSSQDHITKHLKQHFKSEFADRPAPVHTLVKANPKKRQVLMPSEDLFNISRFSQRPPYEIYFSPLLPIQLVNAKIKWRVSGASLYEIEESGMMQNREQTTNGQSLHNGVLWLGVESKDSSLANQAISFHFDWERETTSANIESLLPLIKWSQEGKTLKCEKGLRGLVVAEKLMPPKFLDQEYLFLHRLEKNIRESYENQFVSVQILEEKEGSILPEEICNSFTEETVEKLQKKPCVWLKLVFPHGFSSENIQQLKIRLNCFPVLNRKLDKSKDFAPTQQGDIEICALSKGNSHSSLQEEESDQFLAIDRIFSNQCDYRATAFEQFPQLSVGQYSLQIGRLEADDFRDALVRTEELMQHLKQQSTRFKQVSHHGVQSAVNHLESALQDLNRLFNDIPPTAKTPRYYLHLKTHDPQDMIYIRFWTTQGQAAANVLSEGDLLVAERNGGLEGDGVWVV